MGAVSKTSSVGASGEVQLPLEPPELFVLRDEEGPILYAPLGQLMARANDAAIEAALAYVKDPAAFETMSQDEQAVVRAFDERGFFAPRALPSHETEFRPAQVTLFPTNRCNLRCSYCYAYGGEGGGNGEPLMTMSRDVAFRAIDFVANNAKQMAQEGKPYKNFLVSIHGNGEPFCAYELIQDIVWYAQDLSERIGFPVIFNTATNGVLTEEQLDFVVANFNSVNVSFDGLPEFQDANRPCAGGRGSFEQVDRTMRRLGEAGVGFGIRTTVTAHMVQRMPDIVRFVAQRYPGLEQLHFEPVWECGRCITSSDAMPSAEAFTNSYLAALSAAQECGMHLVFSGARQDMLVDSFCSVGKGGFTVTPTGDVTACYEVSYASDPRSKRFFFGHFDFERGEFVFDKDKLASLSKLNVRNMHFCDDCFCRWHCAGDCAAKVLEGLELSEHKGSVRCEINRALTFNQIQRKLSWGGEALKRRQPTDKEEG